MKKNIKYYHPIIKSSYNILVDLPSPSSISYIWNWGSILALILIIQIVSGILLASHYTPDISTAFYSVIHITRNIFNGWLMRRIHSNGASIFFIIIYIHAARGILFSSYIYLNVWRSGVAILLILIITAFLGYVLPWGQISFWGATVITNLISAIPYLGKSLVEWVWGGFSINQATLSRFFSLHFITPIILAGIIIIHLIRLHITGSNNPIGTNSNIDKIQFHPFFTLKDSTRAIILITFLVFMSTTFPHLIGDPENFNPANPLNTPIHIQPEWYFLFAYAILRSVPRKLGGVIALIISILIILILSNLKLTIKSKKFLPLNKINSWAFFNIFFLLTWIGANPVEIPFEIMGKILRIIYFILVLII